jgi:hypothetical protein
MSARYEAYVRKFGLRAARAAQREERVSLPDETPQEADAAGWHPGL